MLPIILEQQWNGRFCSTWSFWDIEISKPPNKSFLKIIGLGHFFAFFRFFRFVVGPTGCRPYCGFLLLLLLLHHHHPAVSRLSINSHIQAISASPPTYHTSPERGQRLGSSGDDKDDDKDTHKDKYKDKDRAFKTRRKSSCIYKFSYSAQQ